MEDEIVVKGYQLTHWLQPQDSFLTTLKSEINKDYPDVAYTKGKMFDTGYKLVVFIKITHYKMCLAYVQRFAKLKTYESTGAMRKHANIKVS